jgi:hypothetical protein
MASESDRVSADIASPGGKMAPPDDDDDDDDKIKSKAIPVTGRGGL